ncbi:PqqD family protein [Sphingomonas sp. PAMC 26605]|uniref:PqqD family protein n=1 Tax=Sphingomonas sp. PAMC 26605 TaxID=1112214 RepID=UPI00026CDD3E|nr:PqqD family protein [Sphingomonas sp. PAMC 26605]
MSDTMWQRSSDWVGTAVDDSFVMIHLATGTYLTLNRTASAVWAALETPQTQESLEEGLLRRFEVSTEQCRTAVGDLLERMRDLQIAAPL